MLTGLMSNQALEDHGWQKVNGSSSDTARIELEATKSHNYRLVFKLPGYSLQTVTAAGRQCSRIDVPGLGKIKSAGLPELPVVTTTLAIPGGSDVQFKIIEHDTREIRTNPVEPSKGHLSRDVDPNTVNAHFGTRYETGVWPTAAVVVGKPFMLQNQGGVNLRINPLRFDAPRGVLLITERLVVEVMVTGGYDKAQAPSSVEFDSVSEALFGASTPARTDKYQPNTVLGRMLIIAPKNLAEAVTPLVHWKRQRGIPTTLVTVPDVGVASSDIAEIITAAYNEPDGLTWVILVGDRAEMPPATGRYDGSDSDTRYAMISGGDIYPDFFISRISASTTSQVATQVNKFIAYEKFPATGAEAHWYNSALVIASDLGTPSDAQRCDLLRADLLAYGYTPVERIYQNAGGSTNQISEAITTGVSLINYLGHGTGYSWVSVPFRQQHLSKIENASRLPWIVDISCDNGNIALNDCFAEAWLRAGSPTVSAGAIGMIAASSAVPWVPPTVMQSEIVDLLTTDRAFTLGALYYSGLMQVADHYGGLPVAERVLEQNIIFGDCSLQVRTEVPSYFEVNCPAVLPPGATGLSLDVIGSPGAVVTLTGDGVLYETARVETNSALVLSLRSLPTDLKTVDVTASGFNMVPWMKTVSLTGVEPRVNPDFPAAPAQITLLGNFPNPFNPSTRIAFELPSDSPVSLKVYNIRGQLVRDLSTGPLSAGSHEVPWDGQDRRGQPAPSGIYLYKLDAAGQRLTGRMTLSK